MSGTTDEARNQLDATVRAFAHAMTPGLWDRYYADRDALVARAREEGARTVLTNFLLAENGRLFDGEVDHLVTAYLKVAP
jgi:hypothetical protein